MFVAEKTTSQIDEYIVRESRTWMISNQIYKAVVTTLTSISIQALYERVTSSALPCYCKDVIQLLSSPKTLLMEDNVTDLRVRATIYEALWEGQDDIIKQGGR
eukprot:scaffold46343_cov32-Prasinocladus_malaysianus.AAC.1